MVLDLRGIQFLMIFMGIYDTLPLVLGTQLSVLLIPIIGALISGVDVKETFKLRPISFKTVVFSFLIILCSYPIVALLNLVSMLFVENAVVGTAAGLYNHGFIVSMLVMAVCPAIGEEFLMRGVVYRSYQKKSPKLALVLSAVIFGLLHMNFNQMSYAFVMGLLFAILIRITDNLSVTIVLHLLFNCYNVFMAAGQKSAAVILLQKIQIGGYHLFAPSFLRKSGGIHWQSLAIGTLIFLMMLAAVLFLLWVLQKMYCLDISVNKDLFLMIDIAFL